uniref:RAB6A-GEF complex partner protein 2 isoform X2 n=1 Tax=Myxine glutinosa TaxID=7769 RepID=UPI00359000A0
MIDVQARLLRGSVFLAGELLECILTFSNTAPHNVSSTACENLAWASAQIHCQFHASESAVVLPPPSTTGLDVQAENETVFVPNRAGMSVSAGERGQCILSTAPKILFCDLRLDVGESKTYIYSEIIPPDAVPSFRGQAVKYAYKLTIGCQRVNSPIKLLRVPFRVLVFPGLRDYRSPGDGESVAPANPFLDEDVGDEEGCKRDNSLLEVATELIMEATAQRTFNITSPWGKVGRFSIGRTVYRLGEDVVGSFDFSNCTVPCLHLTVLLQSEEIVSEACRRYAGQAPLVTTHAHHNEACVHMLSTHAMLPLPLQATPSFSSETVALKWRLHFQFIVASEPKEVPSFDMDEHESRVWHSTETVEADTLSWDLPITVLPSNPLHAGTVCQLPTFTSISI